MKEILVLRWVVAICILAVSTAALASRAEPNAFLNRKAETVRQLIDQVRADRQVSDRYERHFGKSKDEIIQYFGELHLARLNDEGTYMIYLVDDKGVIKAHPQRLKAGTRVFADASGMPVLKASCGNAMLSGTNAQLTGVSPVIGQSRDTLREIPITIAESSEILVQSAALTPTPPVALLPSTPGQVNTGQKNQSFAVPALLAGLGGAGALMLGGNGGHSPVPEPATIVVMVGALAALRARRKVK